MYCSFAVCGSRDHRGRKTFWRDLVMPFERGLFICTNKVFWFGYKISVLDISAVGKWVRFLMIRLYLLWTMMILLRSKTVVRTVTWNEAKFFPVYRYSSTKRWLIADLITDNDPVPRWLISPHFRVEWNRNLLRTYYSDEVTETKIFCNLSRIGRNLRN